MHPRLSSCELGCAWTEVCNKGQCLCNPSLLRETKNCRHPSSLAWINLFVALLFIFACLWVEGGSQGETLWSAPTNQKKDHRRTAKGSGTHGQEGSSKSKAVQGGGASNKKVEVFSRMAIFSRSALSIGSYAAMLCAVLYCFTPFLSLPSMRVMILVLSFLSLLITIPQGLAVLFTVLSFLKMCQQSSIISSRARGFFSVLSITGIVLTEALSIAQRVLLFTRPSLLQVLHRQLLCLAMQQTLLACTGLPPLLALCRRRVHPLEPETSHSSSNGSNEGDSTLKPVNASSSGSSGGAPLSSSLRNSARKATKPGRASLAKPSPNGPVPGASPEMRDRLVRKATERLSRLLLSTLAATSATALCVVLVICLPHRVPALPALYAIGGCFLVFMDSVQEMHGRGPRPGSSRKKRRLKGRNGEVEDGRRPSKLRYSWSAGVDGGGGALATNPRASGRLHGAIGGRVGRGKEEAEEEEDERLSTIAEASREHSSTRMSNSYKPPPQGALSRGGTHRWSGTSGGAENGPPRPWDHSANGLSLNGRSANELALSGSDDRRLSSSASSTSTSNRPSNQAREAGMPPAIPVAPNEAPAPYRASPRRLPMPEEVGQEEGGYRDQDQDQDQGRAQDQDQDQDQDGGFYTTNSSSRSSRTSSDEMSTSGASTSETVRLDQFADLLQDNLEAYV